MSILEHLHKEYRDSSNIGALFHMTLGFIVNKRGKLIGIRILERRKLKTEEEYTEVEKKVIEAMRRYPIKWNPGICARKEVDVLTRVYIHFYFDENGRLR